MVVHHLTSCEFRESLQDRMQPYRYGTQDERHDVEPHDIRAYIFVRLLFLAIPFSLDSRPPQSKIDHHVQANRTL